MSCHAHVMSCRVVSCSVVSCRVVSCRVVSCRVVSVVSCRVMSCHVMPCMYVFMCVIHVMYGMHMYICMYACMHACIDCVCMYVCMYVCLFGCMYMGVCKTSHTYYGHNMWGSLLSEDSNIGNAVPIVQSFHVCIYTRIHAARISLFFLVFSPDGGGRAEA